MGKKVDPIDRLRKAMTRVNPRARGPSMFIPIDDLREVENFVEEWERQVVNAWAKEIDKKILGTES